MLYIVATPIGNLKDITLRAIETLKNCDFVIAENPSQSIKLLKHYDISKPIQQFAEHNEQKALPRLIEMLRNNSGCLITDAGTPGISDPGFRLVRECWKEGIKIESIPGASAVITALAASGLPTDRFMFVGFLPKTEPKLIKTIELGKASEATLIFFESPFRIIKTLELIEKNFSDATVAIGRELTKMHEEFIRGTATEVKKSLNGSKPKGEFTGLISFK